MHPIQKEIISKLVYQGNLRYSKLKGADLESDQFWFHLKKLVKEGYVVKEDREYVLTEQGRLLSQDFDLSSLQKIDFPLTVVAVVATCGAKYLLLERSRHPFHGFFSFPGGKVNSGETLAQAASRIFQRKVRLQKEEFNLLGIQHEMNTNDGGEVIRDAYVYLMGTELTSEETQGLQATREGRLLLVSKEEALELTPHFREIDTILSKNNFTNFFFEEYKTAQKP